MQAGFNTTIYKADTSTPTSAEAFETADAGAGFLFKVTNQTKNIIDKNVSVTFYENGTPIPASDIDEIMYYIGVVKFKNAKTGVITADYNYLSLVEICFLNSISVTFNNGLQDATTFCSTSQGYVKKVKTIQSATANLDGFYESADNFFTDIVTKDSYIIKIKLGTDNKFDIAFKLKISNQDIGASVENLITSSTSLDSDGKAYVDIF